MGLPLLKDGANKHILAGFGAFSIVNGFKDTFAVRMYVIGSKVD